jgi:hypothetical protein
MHGSLQKFGWNLMLDIQLLHSLNGNEVSFINKNISLTILIFTPKYYAYIIFIFSYTDQTRTTQQVPI